MPRPVQVWITVAFFVVGVGFPFLMLALDAPPSGDAYKALAPFPA